MRAMNEWLKKVRHVQVGRQALKLSAKLRGHFNYYGVRGNSRAIQRFAYEVRGLWKRWLSRRSQRARVTWEYMDRLHKKYRVPPPRLPRRPRQLKLANL